MTTSVFIVGAIVSVLSVLATLGTLYAVIRFRLWRQAGTGLPPSIFRKYTPEYDGKHRHD